jgi:hypothetical protein
MEPFTPDRLIPIDHLVSTCRYRQGEACCKYIFFSAQKIDFYCSKKIEELKEKLDKEIMTAKGDNCPGLPHA